MGSSLDSFGRPCKMRSCLEDGEQPVQIRDCISALPDDMLVHILSFLTIREAAMTACVSTRWRHLWKMCTILILDGHTVLGEGISDGINTNQHRDRQFWDARARKFVEKVNEIVKHHQGICVKKFEVCFHLKSTFASDLDRWVDFAVASGAREVEFYLIEHGKGVRLPGRSYDFHLQRFAGRRKYPFHFLSLNNCNLVTPSKLDGFASLKYLLLANVSVGDADVSAVLSSCSALYCLRLRHCNQLVHLRTSHARLLYLEVLSCKNLESVIIDAMRLLTFEYHGHKLNIKYEAAPILRKMAILFVREEAACPLDCITTRLELRKLFLQFCSPLEESRILRHARSFAGLTEIVLFLLTPRNESILSVAYLLKAAPLLKHLQLESCGDPQASNELDIRWPEQCSLECLQAVIIGGFKGESGLIEFAFFLLQKAPVLKMLIIDTHRHHYRGLGYWGRTKKEDRIICHHARGIALTKLAPRIPSSVKFLIDFCTC